MQLVTSTRNAKRPFRNWLSGVQLLQKSLGLLQVERIEALGEPAIDRRDQFASLPRLPLITPQPCDANRRAQFPKTLPVASSCAGTMSNHRALTRRPKTLLCGHQGWQFCKRGVERRLIQVAILKFAGEVIGIRLHVEVPIAR